MIEGLEKPTTKGRIRFSDRMRANTSRGGARIALVTTVPSIFNEFSGGQDAYSLSRQSITPYSVDAFLRRHQIEGLDVTLFFVPALLGSWTQFDPSFRAQLKNVLATRRPFDAVINLCQAIPLYRRTRIDNSDLFDLEAEVEDVSEFIETLAALAALGRQMHGHYFEPRNFDRASYAFRETNDGTPTITDMRVTPNWLKNGGDLIANSAPQTGFANLQNLALPDDATIGHSNFPEWFSSLGMGTLNSRFIYSDYQWDFDGDLARIWALHEKFAPQPLLFGIRELREQSLPRLLKDKGDVLEAARHSVLVEEKFALLERMIGDASSLKMLDISTLLKLTQTGAFEAGYPTDELGQVFMKKFPFTVAFQRMWDRQSNLYEQDKLNDKINAWYVANGLLHAKECLEDSVPRFTVWAFPTMPTDTVRFFLNPEMQRQSLNHGLVKGLSSLAVSMKSA